MRKFLKDMLLISKGLKIHLLLLLGIGSGKKEMAFLLPYMTRQLNKCSVSIPLCRLECLLIRGVFVSCTFLCRRLRLVREY